MALDIPAANECIYCGSKEDLSKEHIIPLSLGGKVMINSASCALCRNLTSKIEYDIARKSFHAIRAVYKVPTRRPQDYPTSGSVTLKYGKYGPSKLITVPLDQAPIDFIYPTYEIVDQNAQGVTSSIIAASTAEIDAENKIRVDRIFKRYCPYSPGGTISWISNPLKVGGFEPFLWKITHCLLWVLDKDLARTSITSDYVRGIAYPLLLPGEDKLLAKNIYSFTAVRKSKELVSASVLTKEIEDHKFLHFEIDFLRVAGLPTYCCMVENPSKAPIERRRMI